MNSILTICAYNGFRCGDEANITIRKPFVVRLDGRIVFPLQNGFMSEDKILVDSGYTKEKLEDDGVVFFNNDQMMFPYRINYWIAIIGHDFLENFRLIQGDFGVDEYLEGFILIQEGSLIKYLNLAEYELFCQKIYDRAAVIFDEQLKLGRISERITHRALEVCAGSCHGDKNWENYKFRKLIYFYLTGCEKLFEEILHLRSIRSKQSVEELRLLVNYKLQKLITEGIFPES